MSTVTVDFDVAKKSQVPKVGSRKVVRVNGRPESLWVTEVRVEFARVERYDDDGNFLGIRHDYFGQAKLEPFLQVRTLSE